VSAVLCRFHVELHRYDRRVIREDVTGHYTIGRSPFGPRHCAIRKPLLHSVTRKLDFAVDGHRLRNDLDTDRLFNGYARAGRGILSLVTPSTSGKEKQNNERKESQRETHKIGRGNGARL